MVDETGEVIENGETVKKKIQADMLNRNIVTESECKKR